MKNRLRPYFTNDLKQHFCSMWTIAVLAAVVFLTAYSFSRAYGGSMFSIGIIPQTMGFVVLFIGVFCLVYSVYRAQLLTSYQYSLVGQEFVIVSMLCSIILYATAFYIVLLIPFSIVCILYHVCFALWWRYAIQMLMRWVVVSLLSTAIGAFFGLLTKRRHAYLFAIILFLPFTPLPDVVAFEMLNAANVPFFNWINLFNMTLSTPYALNYNLFADEFTTTFLSRCGFGVCLAMCFIGVVFLFKKHISAKIKKIFGGLTVTAVTLAVVLVFTFNSAIPQFYDFYNGEKINYGTKAQAESSYTVQHYALKVDLNHGLQAAATLQLTNIKTNRLQLKLDESLTLRSVCINQTETSFQREKDWVIINLEQPANNASITFLYDGFPNYGDSLRGRSVFVDRTSCYLPECFAWYPQDPEAGYKTVFDLTVKTNNKLVTNLNGNQLFEGSELNCKGMAKQLYVVTGFLGQVKYKNISIIAYEPFIYNFSRINDRIDQNIQMICNEPLPPVPLVNPFVTERCESDNELYQNLSPEELKTILYLPFTYGLAGTLYRLDDTVICSETALSYLQ